VKHHLLAECFKERGKGVGSSFSLGSWKDRTSPTRVQTGPNRNFDYLHQWKQNGYCMKKERKKKRW
jgi:hypothetical protein